MFDKILIANRGEIACRIIRTARRMGIRTVAIHSAADAGALHVEMADEAVAIGPAPAAESYLAIERIVEAARAAGAQAVHPGFGFLAENPAFAKALEAAGIVFIGPPAAAIAAMGDKIQSKKLAAEAGVSIIPGHIGVIRDAEQAVSIAKEIGYPVMIKASAGGGGKGMRIARGKGEVKEGFRSAQSEARSSFGDERVFIEKYLEEPRHIEIQILADRHSNMIHLGERECSVQRRHQKVIEEAPSPVVDPGMRAAMGAQAVALAKAVNYCSAGTVEFIVDKDKRFYFLEMNTRLQVEHPVTELVTGLDLVEQMIRIAAGERLALTQEEVAFKGWAIEVRVYAEDPARGFLPSVGRLTHYREPPVGPTVRVDSGVVEGSEIAMYYDPMFAKLITFAESREKAIAEMAYALDAFSLRGIQHNLNFLSAVMANSRFREGRLSTNFISEEFPEGFRPLPPSAEARLHLVAVAAFLQRRRAEREGKIDGQLLGHEVVVPTDWVVVLDGGAHAVQTEPYAAGVRIKGLAERPFMVESDWQIGEMLFRGRIDGWQINVQIDSSGPAWRLTHAGSEVEALVLTQRAAELAAAMPNKAPPDHSKLLLSPMPGLLVSLAVEIGQEIKAGEQLAVVEAMKMENVLRADRDGKVLRLYAAPGDSLAVDQAILEYE